MRRVIVGTECALRRVDDLHREHDAEFHADIVSGEHFLAGDGEQRLANVDLHEAVVLTPAHMATGSERFAQLAFVVQQTREAFARDELTAIASTDDLRRDRTGERQDKDQDVLISHVVVSFLFWFGFGVGKKLPIRGSSHRSTAGNAVEEASCAKLIRDLHLHAGRRRRSGMGVEPSRFTADFLL